jgi:hypothetical protein
MPRKSTAPHEPTKTTRDTVSLHALVGTPQELIADLLSIDPKTLRKYYRKELDHSLAHANATVGGALYRKATNGDTTAQIFWLKTRAGFREKQEEAQRQPTEINISFTEATKPE